MSPAWTSSVEEYRSTCLLKLERLLPNTSAALAQVAGPHSLPKPCSTGPAAEPTQAGPAQEHLQILLSQGGLPTVGPETHCT